MQAGRPRAAWAASHSVFAQPQLRRAVLAFAWELTGEWAVSIAVAVIAFEDGGAAGVGLVALVRMMPSAIGTPIVLAMTDRLRRERALAAVSAMRVFTVGGAALLLAVDAHHALVYALVVLATAALTVFRPTHSALLPLLCTTTSELTNANVVRGLLESLATLIGPMLAAGLLAWRGPADVFFAAAILSAVAAVLLTRIRYDAPGRTAPVGGGHPLHVAANSLRGVAQDRDLRLIFGLGFVQTYARGAFNVFTVVMAFDLLGLGEPGVAALTAALGGGALLGSLAVSSLLAGSPRLGGWLVVALVFWGAPIAIIGTLHPVPVVFVLVAMIGVANAVIDVPLSTLPVRLVRDEALGRVFGVFESVATIGVAVGSALTPVAIAWFGLGPAMVATGLLLPVIAALTWRPFVALDDRLAVKDAEIAVLRATPMLELLPVPSIEYLASRAATRRIPAATTVCVQGEPGDTFFVIAEGSADVVGDGAHVRTLHAGDTFGEIALLRDGARTASVWAREDLVLLEIGRDTFLDVVAGHSTSHATAEGVASRRLADFRPARIGI